MKNTITLSLIRITFLFIMFSYTSQLFASNTITINALSIIDEEWKVFVETNEISIYYTSVKDNPCMSYKLKIVNHSNRTQTVSFDVIAKMASDCKYQYKDFNEFRYRTVEIVANATIIGNENIKSLLLPTTNGSLKELIQHLSLE